jgi:hypothetical protein
VGVDVAERWAALSVDQRRVAQELIEAVTVRPGRPGRRFDPDRIDIVWPA